MKLKELVNSSFDVNCNISVFEGIHNDGGKCVYSTLKTSDDIPSAYLDKQIKYITVGEKRELIIEI